MGEVTESSDSDEVAPCLFILDTITEDRELEKLLRDPPTQVFQEVQKRKATLLSA